VSGGSAALRRMGHTEGLSNCRSQGWPLISLSGCTQEHSQEGQRRGPSSKLIPRGWEFERGKPTKSAGFKDVKGKPSHPQNTIPFG